MVRIASNVNVVPHRVDAVFDYEETDTYETTVITYTRVLLTSGKKIDLLDTNSDLVLAYLAKVRVYSDPKELQ